MLLKSLTEFKLRRSIALVNVSEHDLDLKLTFVDCKAMLAGCPNYVSQ